MKNHFFLSMIVLASWFFCFTLFLFTVTIGLGEFKKSLISVGNGVINWPSTLSWTFLFFFLGRKEHNTYKGGLVLGPDATVEFLSKHFYGLDLYHFFQLAGSPSITLARWQQTLRERKEREERGELEEEITNNRTQRRGRGGGQGVGRGGISQTGKWDLNSDISETRETEDINRENFEKKTCHLEFSKEKKKREKQVSL